VGVCGLVLRGRQITKYLMFNQLQFSQQFQSNKIVEWFGKQCPINNVEMKSEQSCRMSYERGQQQSRVRNVSHEESSI
jgi:hypothetical protein